MKKLLLARMELIAKGSTGTARNVLHDQPTPDLSFHCLLRTICLNINGKYGNVIFTAYSVLKYGTYLFHTGKCICRFASLRILSVLHRADVVGIFIGNRFEYRSNTYHPDPYSNLFLNAYINRHVYADYLNIIKFYSPFGIQHVFLYSINTNIYHILSKYRQYV